MTDNTHNEYKMIAIINKKLDQGIAMNAIAHLACGLTAHLNTDERQKMNFLSFVDKDDNLHPSISALSLVVKRGTPGNIRTVREKAKDVNIAFVDFTNTMTGDTYKEQLMKTKNTPEADLEYYGILLFGKTDDLFPITKKYSLWK